jgi:DnaJ-class molecular chaperone
VKYNKAKTSAEALTILGLPPGQNPTVDAVKRAYKALALQFHPDRNPGDDAALARFMEISYAYELLTNPQFRVQQEPHDLNVVANLMISFDDAFFGKPVYLFATVAGPVYHGADDSRTELTIQPLTVQVPPGTISRDYRFAGHGYRRDGLAGDFLVTIQAQPHPLFKMDQLGNVSSEVQVPLRIMLKGGRFDVQTMYGIKTLLVPPGTRPRDQIRMPGLGVERRGHHVVTVDLDYPSSDELKTHQDWRQIDINWAPPPPAQDDELEALRGTFLGSL